MNIRIEDTNGKRTYYVNDIPYNSLQEMPEEYRSFFADADNSGVPDQFDSLFNLARGKAGFREVMNMFTSDLRPDDSHEVEEAPIAEAPPQKKYLRDEGRTRGSFPLYIKVLFVLAIVFLIAWFVVTRLQETPGAPESKETTLAESR